MNGENARIIAPETGFVILTETVTVMINTVDQLVTKKGTVAALTQIEPIIKLEMKEWFCLQQYFLSSSLLPSFQQWLLNFTLDIT